MDSGKISSELLSLASRRLDIFRELVRLAEEQRAILVEGRHGDLLENVRKNESLLLTLNQVEKHEQALVELLRDAGNEHGFRPAYRHLNQQVLEVAGQLRDLVSVNRELLENAAEYIRYSVSVLSEAVSDSSGGLDSDRRNCPTLLIDRKA